jgi:hypothetical protein
VKDPDMSPSRRLAAVAVLAPFALATVAAYAPDPLPENCRIVNQGDPSNPDDDLEVCDVRTYFECPGAVPVNNVTQVQSDAVPSWSETEPGSFADGNGCGTVDPGALVGRTVDTTFEGTFDGRIDGMDIVLHATSVPYDITLGGPLKVGVTVEIDGAVLYDNAETDVNGTVDETGLIAEYVIGIPNVGRTGFADDGTHDVKVIVSQWFIDTVGLQYMGAAEVPSGIRFNPPTVSFNRPLGA